MKVIDRFMCVVLMLVASAFASVRADSQDVKGQSSKLASELKAPHKHVVMRNSDGAGEHCHMGAMRLLHQTIFDWLHVALALHHKK